MHSNPYAQMPHVAPERPEDEDPADTALEPDIEAIGHTDPRTPDDTDEPLEVEKLPDLAG